MRQTFRWSEAEKTLLPLEEWLNKYGEYTNTAHIIIRDIQPYQSQINGKMITSRSQHRNHLRDHGCIEVGNDSSIQNPVYKPPGSPPGLKEKIIQAVNQHTRKR